MIVAGIGCRKAVSGVQVAGAVHHALEQLATKPQALGLIATGSAKRDEPGIAEAAAMLSVPLLLLDNDQLVAAAGRCLTHSKASFKATGLPSLSEASAIAAAGPQGRLLGQRIVLGDVTCALATTAHEITP